MGTCGGGAYKKKKEGGDRKEGRGAENKRETGYCYARGALDPSPFFFSLDRRRRRRRRRRGI